MIRRVTLILLTVLLLGPISSLQPAEDVRKLSFYHTHTSEELSVTYYVGGQYDVAALRELNHFLRDFRTGDEIEMDPNVFDILYDIQQRSGSTGVYQVISAYRSPATNEMLRRRSGGVARTAKHWLGKPIIFRLPNLTPPDLPNFPLPLMGQH